MTITLLLWPPRQRPNLTGSRRAPKPLRSNFQLLLIADLFQHPPVPPFGGWPRVEPRPCLEGIGWMLASDAGWKDLLERYPSVARFWRRHHVWIDCDIFLKAWKRMVGELDRLNGIR